MKKNKVVIIGRPNTGKSTLFNKIVGKKKALTSRLLGTTRDIISSNAAWQGTDFQISDSGGLEYKIKTNLEKNIRLQTEKKLQQTDVILFLVNVREGITSQDQEIARKLKPLKKKTILVVNKCDNSQLREQALEFYKLGLGKPLAISAASGTGTGDLLDKVISYFRKTPLQEITEEQKQEIKVGILGKPNVGKSSLFNAICGENKVIISQDPGTTRDAIDTEIIYQNLEIILTDTAGLRRKTKIDSSLEKYSTKTSLKTIKRSDICLLVIDINEKISRQDLRIASQIIKNKKGIILIANKWDKITPGLSAEQEEIKAEDYKKYLKRIFNSLPWAPLIFTSAKKKKNINKILETIVAIRKEKETIIKKEDLESILAYSINNFFQKKDKKTKLPKINNFTQSTTSPTIFNLYVKNKRNIPPPFINFLEKKIRKKYNFLGMPLSINLKS